jgi:hypothetical protein
MKLTCGVDWAEAHYDVALVDGDGVVVARARIDTGATGFNKLLALIAEHEGSAQDTPVSIETDKNLLVVALVEAGFTVYPINPRAVARYRERYGQAGGKSDPGDAACSRTFCAPTDICTARCQRSASRDAQSRRWPVSTKRRSGRCTKPSAVYDRCCWSSIRKRCKHFRISHTRQH